MVSRSFPPFICALLQAQDMKVILASPSGGYVSPIQVEGFHWLNWQVGSRQSINPLDPVYSRGLLV